MSTSENRRVLLVDDLAEHPRGLSQDPCPAGGSQPTWMPTSAILFGQPASHGGSLRFELDSAYQGIEALEKVRAARLAGLPYAMAFIDMRMPPGWDGVETVEHLWREDPRLQIVFCTAYSDTPGRKY